MDRTKNGQFANEHTLFSRGKDHHSWGGGRVLLKDGKGRVYAGVFKPGHPRAKSRQYVKEEVLIVEKVIGKHLPEKAVIHHVNNDSLDNRNENLVVCESGAYHATIHLRTRAYRDGGNAHYRKCNYCGNWDDPKILYVNPKGNAAHHRECYNKYRNNYNKLKKENQHGST